MISTKALILLILSSLAACHYICYDRYDGNYRNPYDCTHYIVCVAGRAAYNMPCPKGLHYNEYYDRCDWKHKAHCTQKSGPSNLPIEQQFSLEFCTEKRRIYNVGEKFITSDCNAYCTCGRRGVIGCVSLCPPSNVLCKPGEKKVTIKVPVAKSACFCEEPRCV